MTAEAPSPPPGEPPAAEAKRARTPAARAAAPQAQRDRWAHRRAEPRMLAFAWTLYLLIATGLSFARIGLVEPVDVQVYRASARVLLLSVAIGACALWPMVRLSQALPRRPLWSTFRDLLVIVAPMQAVIWGQALLSGWPIRSLGAVAVALGAWTAICGGILAMAMTAGARGGQRVGAMVAVLAITCAGMIVVSAEGLGPRTGLLTPFTVPWTLLGRDLTLGYTLGPTRAQWAAVAGLCLAAGAPWLVAVAMSGLGRRGDLDGPAGPAGGAPQRIQGANNRPLAESAAKR